MIRYNRCKTRRWADYVFLVRSIDLSNSPLARCVLKYFGQRCFDEAYDTGSPPRGNVLRHWSEKPHFFELMEPPHCCERESRLDYSCFTETSQLGKVMFNSSHRSMKQRSPCPIHRDGRYRSSLPRIFGVSWWIGLTTRLAKRSSVLAWASWCSTCGGNLALCWRIFWTAIFALGN